MSDYWSWNNAVDASDATLESATGSAGDLVTANLKDVRVGKPWRAGSMPAELTVNLPATGGVSIIGLFGVNLAELSTLEIEVYNDAEVVWSEEITDLTGRQVVLVRRDELDRLAPVNATKVIISATGTTLLQIGRVWVGTADWEPAFNHSPDGSSWGIIDLSSVTRTPRSGAPLVDINARLRTFTAAYAMLQESEWGDLFYRLDTELGLAAQMLFIPEPSVYSLARSPILGRRTELTETKFVNFLTGARSLTIQEDG